MVNELGYSLPAENTAEFQNFTKSLEEDPIFRKSFIEFLDSVNESKPKTFPSAIAIGGTEEIGLRKLNPEDIEKYLWMHPVVPRGIEIKSNRIVKKGYKIVPFDNTLRSKKDARDMEELLERSGGVIRLKKWAVDTYGFGNGYITLVPNNDGTEIVNLIQEHPIYFRIARKKASESIVTDPYKAVKNTSFAPEYAGDMKIDSITRKPEAFSQVKFDPKLNGFIPIGNEIPSNLVAHLTFDTWGDEVEGISLVQYLFLTIKHLLNIEDAGAETLYRSGFTQKVVTTEITTKNDLKEMARNLKDINSKDAIIVPKGTDVKNLTPGTTEFAKYHDVFVSLLAIRLGIPKPHLTLDGTCYTEDTETLTDNGWKFWYDITEEDKIAVYDKENNSITFEFPKDMQVYNYDGNVYTFKNKCTNFSVTPNHNVLFRTYTDNSIYTTSEAENIPNEYFLVKTNGVYTGKRIEKVTIPSYSSKMLKTPELEIDGDIFCELLGWYLSEGCSVFGQTRIHQNEGEKADIIRTLLNKLGLGYSENLDKRNRNVNVSFRIKHAGLAKYLQQFGSRSFNKTIPSIIKNASEEQMKLFLEAFKLGDGSVSSNGHVSYFTSSKEMADSLQEILFKCGYKTKIRCYKDMRYDGQQTMYVISVHKSLKGETLLCKDENVTISSYKGIVYCFETSTGFFVTRREGKIAIQGNSTNKSTVQEQSSFIMDDFKADELVLKRTVEEQIFKSALRYKYGDEYYQIPKFVFNEIPEDKELRAERMMKLSIVTKNFTDSYQALSQGGKEKEAEKLVSFLLKVLDKEES